LVKTTFGELAGSVGNVATLMATAGGSAEENGGNAFLILTADTTLNVSNVSAGDYGTLLVKQDASGGHALAPPGSSAVV